MGANADADAELAGSQTGQGERGRILVLYGRLPRPRGQRAVYAYGLSRVLASTARRGRGCIVTPMSPRPGSMRRLPTKRSSL